MYISIKYVIEMGEHNFNTAKHILMFISQVNGYHIEYMNAISLKWEWCPEFGLIYKNVLT